ncbi:MAG TPA: Rieske (2Fe-2S) protein [Vicinamibacteria bacterium]|nr:Rieske (2Fe-2S) protein [Vicinamibacteria bacterium]
MSQSGNGQDPGVESHAARIAELVAELEALPDSEAKAKALELVENVDHLHRTCVWRLFEILSELGGKGLIERMVSEPAVKALFVLYDLIPSQPLTPVESPARVSAPFAGGFVPLSAIEGIHAEPSWHVVFAREDLPPGSLRAVEVDGTPLLLASTGDAVFAYRNSCGGSILPLHLGTLVDGEIHCPWHGCRYDVETGKKSGGIAGGLEAFRVVVDGDRIRIQRR